MTDIIYTQPWTGGPYYRVPIANTYPPQYARLPVNGTSVATLPTCCCPVITYRCPNISYPAVRPRWSRFKYSRVERDSC